MLSHPAVKWVALAVVLYFVVTQPGPTADFAIAVWDILILIVQGIFSFLQELAGRF